MRRFSSVFLSYSFREASRVVRNLGEREPRAVEVVSDISNINKARAGDGTYDAGSMGESNGAREVTE